MYEVKQPVAAFTNSDLGVTAKVWDLGGKWSVSLVDDDSDETVQTLKMFPKEVYDKAVAYAKSLVESSLPIQEKFATSYKSVFNGTTVVDIYVNPTKDELEEAGSYSGEIRYIADAKTKKIYVVESWHGLHEDMAAELDLPIYDSSGRFNFGYAEQEDEDDYGDPIGPWKATSLSSRIGGPMEIKELQKIDWSWADRYVKGLNAILKTKRRR